MSIRRSRRPKPRPTFAPAGSVLVLIMAGQSNAEGDGSATFTYTFLRTQTYFKPDYTTTSDSGSFAALEFNANNSTGTSQVDTESEPQIYIAQLLESLVIEQIRTIKVAIGGTGFGNGAGLWAQGNALENALKNHYIKPSLSKLAATGADIRILPILWVQGENDAQSAPNASAYQSQLQTFIDNVRGYTVPNIPWIIVRLNEALNLATYTQANTIRAAQDSISAGDKNITLLNLDDIGLGGDLVHYTDAGFQTMARRYLHLARKMGTRKYADSGTVSVTSPPAVSNQGSSSIDVSATISEYGTLYVGIYSNGTTNPGTAAIQAGTGAGYIASGSTPLIYDASGTFTVTGLSASTTYAVFAFIEDLVGNQSAVQTLSATTTTGGGPSVIFSDSFTEASTVNLSAHIPETGTGWTVVSGTINVSGALDRAVGVDSSTSAYLANQTPSGIVNQISCIFKTADVGVGGIIFRGQDANNFLALFFRGTPPYIRLFRKNAGSYTELTSYTTPALGSFVDVSLIIQWNSSEFRVSVNGSTLVTETNSLLSGSNRCGIEFRRITHEVDNFIVSELSAFTI